MKFAGPLKSITLLLVTAALSACGGGGGGGNDSGFNPPGVNLTASSANVALNTRSAASITIRMLQANGAPVANGTAISGVVNGAGLGNLAAIGSGTSGITSQGTTNGGAVTFIFQSGSAPANGNITFSGQDPTTPGRTLSTNVTITVSSGPGSDPRISFQPEKTQLPVNALGVPFFLGSPYIAEVLINIRSASGQPINDTRDGDQAVQLSIDPVEITAVSVLDDPETEDVNELTTPWGSIFDGPTVGTVRAFVWSETQPGTVNLRAAFTDPDTGQRVEGVQQLQIVSSVPPGPASVTIAPPQNPVYVRDSGGTTFGQLQINVLDGNNTAVPNPTSGSNAFNNLRVEILQPNGEGDAVLSATSASGQSQEGESVVTRTTDGITTIAVRSGDRTGTYTVRATADRADNNVDNGISDPIVGDRAIVISDGRLFSIAITQPVEGLRENLTVDPTATATDEDGNLPLSPDGTYSLTVAAIATDRLGNPVIPGTTINFGLIDFPQDFDFSGFDLSGNDGNPQESGTLFTAPFGQFTTAGGGAGPGDALVIFGHEVEGNRDHESARVISSVNSATSLTVERRFNRNDDTGVSVDSGNALPYVIGRATRGNILAQGQTNEFGVVRTVMSYPVTHLGVAAVVWAQGEGDIIGGEAETVADVDPLVYAGAAPLQLTASPTSIPANGTSEIGLCVLDALGSPIQGVVIGYSFNDLEGSGSVDGSGASGAVDQPTDGSGCTSASVTTAGVLSGGSPTVVFNAGGATAEVEITTATLVLQARPSALTNSGTVTLTLLNGQGAPQPGFLIVGECTSDGGAAISLRNGPGVTNASGQTTVEIVATNLNGVGEAGSGDCTFQTADGEAEATVTLQGVDICTVQFSPPPSGCPEEDVEQFDLTANVLAGATAGTYVVSSSPAGINCSAPGGATLPQSCSAQFDEDSVVTLTTTGPAGATFVGWTGECVAVGGNPRQALVTMSGARVCNADWD